MDEYQALRNMLISNMKRGSFTPDGLLEPARRLEKLLREVFGSRVNDQPELFKIRAYISEVYYFFDLKKEARQVLTDGYVERVGVELFDDGRKLNAADCPLKREKVRAYLAYVQACYYGREQYERAAAEFENCVTFIRTKLMRDHGFQSDSTLALSYYNLGRALRQCSRYEEAMHAFSEALKFFHRRYQTRLRMFEEKEAELLRQIKRPRTQLEQLAERRKDEMMMFHHRSGLVFGRGMAWTNYARGQLLTALTENIVPATVFLDETKDEISKGYLNLIESTILRNRLDGSRPETRKQELERAEQLLQKSIDSFQAYRHKSYESRALYELSIILLYKRQFDSALTEINKVIQRVDGKSVRWHANSLVYRARIRSYGSQQEESWPVEYRKKQLLEALNDTQEAMNKASVEQTTCVIDSLIVQADTNLQLAELDGYSRQWLDASLQALERLYELNSEVRNPRIDAYYYLYRTLRALEINDLDEAAKCRSTWQAIQPQVKDDWAIAELARQVESKAHNVKQRSFVVTIADSSDPAVLRTQFDFVRLRRELLEFLVGQASLRGVKTRAELFKLLNIDKNLYHSVNKPSRRKRIRRQQIVVNSSV